MRDGFRSCAIFLAALAFAMADPAPHGAAAQSLDTLYSFCTAQDCADGGPSSTPLVGAPDGTLYGAASEGGAHGVGVVFALVPGSGGTWQHKVLHDFCADEDCADGAYPGGSLLIDRAGNLYGLAITHDPGDDGVLFRLTPNADRSHWKYKVLYRFADTQGAAPAALTYAGAALGAAYDGTSPLYGTTCCAGTASVFEISFDGRKWKGTTLYNFSGADGVRIFGVTVAPSGDLFGTTPSGGAHGRGSVFQIAKTGDGWSEHAIYDFCGKPSCADGATPEISVVSDAAGNLYGTADEGGKRCPKGRQFCNGTLFKLSPVGNGAWKYRVLHDFCLKRPCADGGTNYAQLLVSPSGDIFGNTAFGGTHDAGAVFELPANGKFRVLYDFCALTDCADGRSPSATLAIDPDSNLYGTTGYDGAGGHGTVFEVRP